MTAASLPNLIIAGVGKAGTTSLFDYLSQHPDVCASPLKELNYFTVLRDPDARLPPIEEYARNYRHCRGERYRLEASPSYWYGGEPVVRAIAETLADVQVIVSLRDPTTRLWSAFTYLKSMGRIDHTLAFEDYVAKCEAQLPTDGTFPQVHTPLSVGLYSQYIQPWFDTFGERLHVVFAEHLFTRPREVMTYLCTRLDLDSGIVGHLVYASRNQTIAPRSYALARLADAARRSAGKTFGRRPALRRTVRRLYRSVNARAQSQGMSTAMRLHLDRFYSPSSSTLAAQLRARAYEDLPEWLRAN